MVSPQRRSQLRYPERASARAAVAYAVKRGKLPPVTSIPCTDCGQSAAEYDHWRGYEKVHWLDVQAVCKPCHQRRTNATRLLRVRFVNESAPHPAPTGPTAADRRMALLERIRAAGNQNSAARVRALIKERIALAAALRRARSAAIPVDWAMGDDLTPASLASAYLEIARTEAWGRAQGE